MNAEELGALNKLVTKFNDLAEVLHKLHLNNKDFKFCADELLQCINSFPDPWQPINTAPRNKQEILVCSIIYQPLSVIQKNIIYKGYFDPEYAPYIWIFEFKENFHEEHFTHWRTMPMLPKE